MTSNLPTIIYHPLQELSQKKEIDLILTATFNRLNSGHITSIVNAFFVNTKICVNGIPFIKVQGLSTILRTGNSGAERPLIYQGIKGIISRAEIIEIEGVEYISGPALRALIDARMALTSGRTREYLAVAMNSYERILNLSEIRNLKDIFLDDIQNNRPLLKTQRIAEYNITLCEFSGTNFSNNGDVEFAHIESVVTNPMQALNIDNGVIILKSIHKSLTQARIHGFEGMYNFCLQNNYSTSWAD